MSVTLADKLLSLAKILVEEIDHLRATGGLVSEEMPYVKFRVDFEFKDGEMTRFSKDIEEVKKNEFGTYNKNISQLTNKVLERADSSEFGACIDGISESAGVARGDAGALAYQFITSLAFTVIHSDDTTEDFLKAQIANFIHTLGTEPDWKIWIWLSGIWVDQSQIELIDGAILRQPTASDFEIEVSASFLPYHTPDIDEMSVMAILELNVQKTSARQISLEITKYVNLLRLFRLGEITSLKHTIRPNRITGLMFGTSVTSFGMVRPRYKYEVKEDDVVTFAQYYKDINPHLEELTKQDDFIGIAYHRYVAAFSEELVEGSIALAINCLEALYLGEVEGELSHRLSQRTAALLRQKITDPGTIIYQKMQVAYTIRSKFVHGAVESKKATKRNERRQTARDLREPILNFARVSLLIFLQLKKAKNKDEFLKLIDSSLLDETSHKVLVDLVKSTVVT